MNINEKISIPSFRVRRQRKKDRAHARTSLRGNHSYEVGNPEIDVATETP
jgi:hypothetical protein